MPKASKRPKQRNRVQFMPRANERKVNYTRDIPASMSQEVPQHVKDQLDALSMVHTQQRSELDVLRKTRGQRTLEPLKVPAHLRGGVTISDAGVRRLVDIPTGTNE